MSVTIEDKERCEKCGTELKILKLNRKEIGERIEIQLSTFRDLIHTYGLENLKELLFRNYTYYECPFCCWFKFRRG